MRPATCLSGLLVFCWVAWPAEAGTLAQFRTPFGDIDVELYDREKPVTVENFKRLVASDVYRNTFLHRVVPGFIAQGGGYATLNPFSTNLFAPPWAGVVSVLNFGTITNEYSVGPWFSNTNGTIAMAKLGTDPDSATSEWFFNLADNSANLDHQNGGFTVFGRVLRDTGPAQYGGVLGMLNLVSFGNGLLDMGWWYAGEPAAENLFSTLPVTFFSGAFHPRIADLLYVNISVLKLNVGVDSQNQRELSWTSINGRTNYVEYATSLPPTWQTLVATNGNGSPCSVVDVSPAARFRCYRLRVDY